MLLQGITIIDLSNLLPGPFCSLFLADLGADVLKVESLNGDPMRGFEAQQNTPSPYFLALNRNKKSIALDLKKNEGKKIFLKIVKNADVVIEGFRPGKTDSLGIGYDDVKKINPKIIYCSITGYGQKGPYKNKAGHDLNYNSLSGVLETISKKPFVSGVQIADVGSGLIAAFSIVSALLYRKNSNKGCHIDIPILDGALSLIGMHVAYGSLSPNQQTVLSGSEPCYNVYETKDGKFVGLGAIESKFWEAFCNVVKRKDLIKRQFDQGILREIHSLFKAKTLKEWLQLNDKYDFCCEPVKKIEDILKEDYFKNRKMLIDLDGVAQVGMPAIFSAFKKYKYSKSPRLGQDTRNILKSFGYDETNIKKLKMDNVII